MFGSLRLAVTFFRTGCELPVDIINRIRRRFRDRPTVAYTFRTCDASIPAVHFNDLTGYVMKLGIFLRGKVFHEFG